LLDATGNGNQQMAPMQGQAQSVSDRRLGKTKTEQDLQALTTYSCPTYRACPLLRLPLIMLNSNNNRINRISSTRDHHAALPFPFPLSSLEF
jgi:hypothetical protein